MAFPKRLHLVGVAGTGMVGLARVLLENGFRVSGSDRTPTRQTEELIEHFHCEISYLQRAANVGPDVCLVVASAAIPADHPELAAARARGLRVVRYAEVLGMLMSHGYGVAVAGTHGKTGTTALLAHILIRAGRDPSFVIGGELKGYRVSAQRGAGPVFLAEACEFQRSFLSLPARAALVTNIEADHLDCYADLDEIRAAFGAFLGRLDGEGLAVLNADDPQSRRLLAEGLLRARVITTSVGRPGAPADPDAHWQADRLVAEDGRFRFRVRHLGREFDTVRLAQPGRHQVSNALQAIALAAALRVDFGVIARACADFPGVRRRFDVVGEAGGVTFIDDYAHHPTELEATLAAARRAFPGRRLWAVFQPHQYSRTRALFAGFAQAFGDADQVLVNDIYAARDTEAARAAVSAQALVEALADHHHAARHVPTREAALDVLRAELAPGDVVLTLGAGDITELAPMILEQRGRFFGPRPNAA